MMRAFVACLAAMTVGCETRLPEPESAGARLYRDRCGDCHRLYAPELLKAEMWKYQVERMQGEMVRRGAPPLKDDERATILEYLQKHAGS